MLPQLYKPAIRTNLLPFSSCTKRVPDTKCWKTIAITFRGYELSFCLIAETPFTARAGRRYINHCPGQLPTTTAMTASRRHQGTETDKFQGGNDRCSLSPGTTCLPTPSSTLYRLLQSRLVDSIYTTILSEIVISSLGPPQPGHRHRNLPEYYNQLTTAQWVSIEQEERNSCQYVARYRRWSCRFSKYGVVYRLGGTQLRRNLPALGQCRLSSPHKAYKTPIVVEGSRTTAQTRPTSTYK